MPVTIIHLFRESPDRTSEFFEWITELEETDPRAFVKCLARLRDLAQRGSELRRPLVDSLRDGIHELRVKVGRVNYRILYFFCGKNIVCVSHAMTKEREIPASEIDLAVQRKRLVEKNPAKHLADVEWE